MTAVDRSTSVLEQRARLLAQRPPAPRAAVEELLVVAAGGHLFAVPLHRTREVLPPGPVASVPDAPAALVGVRDSRGGLLAVADLVVLLGLAGDRSFATTHVVVLEDAEPLGLLVDRPVAVVEWEPQLAHFETGNLVTGIVRHGTEEIGVLDCDRVLADPRVGGSRPSATGPSTTGAG